MSHNSNSISPDTGAMKSTAKEVHPLNEDKSPALISSNKEEAECLILHPEIFQISQDTLVNFVKESEKRKFSEEIDKIEQIGGDQMIERGLATSFSKGISENEEEIHIREAEYGTNRREDRVPESN